MHITNSAKIDIIAATQVQENERHRLEVSRSFVCRCAKMLRPLCLCSSFECSGHVDRYVFDNCIADGRGLNDEANLSSLQGDV
jgi:hypothetical protein